jgi:hypothetical protein
VTRLPASKARAALALLLHALVIWGLCGATTGIAMCITSLANALLFHAAAAPVIAGTVSLVYFRRYAYTTPLVTAGVVLAAVVLADFFLVALVINRSMDMFRSVIGTWLPFLLIFVTTYIVGILARRDRR